MRTPFRCLALVALLAGAGGTEEPPARPADTTIVRGQLPAELVGRWLAVVHARPSLGLIDQPQPVDGQGFDVKQTGSHGQVPVVRAWEITRDGDRVTMNLLRGKLPEPLEAAVTKGVDAATLDAVAVQWPAMAAPRPEEPKTIESQLEDFANAPAEDKRRIETPGIRFLVVTTEEYASRANMVRNTSLFAVTSMAPDRLTGRFVGAMLLPPQRGAAIILPPLPVGLEGDFTAYRITEPRSVMRRLLDVFGGCGREGR